MGVASSVSVVVVGVVMFFSVSFLFASFLEDFRRIGVKKWTGKIFSCQLSLGFEVRVGLLFLVLVLRGAQWVYVGGRGSVGGPVNFGRRHDQIPNGIVWVTNRSWFVIVG